MGRQKRPLTIDDLELVEHLSSPDVAPEGNEAVYVVTTRDVASDGYLPRIFGVSITGVDDLERNPDRLPEEGIAGELPRYSPDGRYLAFLATERGDRQIHCIERDTGIERSLTTLRRGVDDYCWSPDGSKIAFVAPLRPNEDDIAFELMTNNERRQYAWELEHTPRVVEELVYKRDESFGLVDDLHTQIGVIDLETDIQRMLTSGTADFFGPGWSPDGELIAAYGRPFPHAIAMRPALFTIDTAEGRLTQLTDREALLVDDSPPVFTADGRSLIYCGYRKGDDGVYLKEPFTIRIEDGDTNAIFKEPQPCHGLGRSAGSRTCYGRFNPAYCLNADGSELWFVSAEEGNDGVYHVPLSGGVAKRVTTADGCVHSFCPPSQDHLVYTRGEPHLIAELFVRDLTTGTERRLTRSNRWLEEISLGGVHEFSTAVGEERPSIHGFVILPGVLSDETKPGEKTRFPAVLYIHGGPDSSYARDFWFEFQYLAASGVAVIACDPRGSAGYGSAFQKGDVAFGQESMDDLFAYVDAAIDAFPIDGEALGVTGGSYGGHMTNRIICHTNRFRAAVTQRTLCNLATSYGTGDMGFIQTDTSFTTMLRMLTERAKSRSTILSNIDRIDTPLLILHGTHDFRCSFEQAEQLFIAMKERRPQIPVRLVAFPGENHDLTRTGKLHSQKAHITQMTEWFRKYLPTPKTEVEKLTAEAPNE